MSESRSAVSDSTTPWTVESMEFSKPEYWSGSPFPSSGGLPNTRIEPRSPTLQANSLPAEPQGKPKAQVTIKGWIHLTWTYNLNNWRFTNYLSTFGRKHIYFLASNCNRVFIIHTRFGTCSETLNEILPMSVFQ